MAGQQGNGLVVLGLLVFCAQFLISRTCNTDFTDVQTRAYLAHYVFVGRVQSKTSPVNSKYKATFIVEQQLKGKIGNRKRPPPVTIKGFGPSEPSQCISNVVEDEKYIVFLDSNQELSDMVEKYSSRTFRKVKGIVAKKSAKRIKKPVINSIKNISAEEGSQAKVTCRVTSLLPVKFTWYKDGKEFKKKRGIQIKVQKNESLVDTTISPDDYEIVSEVIDNDDDNSTLDILELPVNKKNRYTQVLRIRRFQRRRHRGSYSCKATNVLGDTSMNFTITEAASPAPPVNIVTTQKEDEVTTVNPSESAPSKQYLTCPRQTWCFNGGTCIYIPDLVKGEITEKNMHCMCTKEYIGKRCGIYVLPVGTTEGPIIPASTAIIVACTVVGALIIIAICIAVFLKYRRSKHRGQITIPEGSRFGVRYDGASSNVDMVDFSRGTENKSVQTDAVTIIEDPTAHGPTHPQGDSDGERVSGDDESCAGSTSSRQGRQRLQAISGTPASLHRIIHVPPPPQGPEKSSSPSQNSKTESESAQQHMRHSSSDADSADKQMHLSDDPEQESDLSSDEEDNQQQTLLNGYPGNEEEEYEHLGRHPYQHPYQAVYTVDHGRPEKDIPNQNFSHMGNRDRPIYTRPTDF